MIFQTQPAASPPQLDLTPLINIVFLMLVFFMLAGSLAPLDPVQSARVDSTRRLEAGLLIVSVDQQGVAMIDGAAVNDETMQRRLTAHQTDGGRVGIRPDARLQAQRLVELTGLVRAAGFDQMTLVTQTR